MKLPLILKQEETDKKTPVNKKLEENVWEKVVSSR